MDGIGIFFTLLALGVLGFLYSECRKEDRKWKDSDREQ